MANALATRGVIFGDRVATLAWNGHRHMELYYAVSGSGAVLHTLNPRLHPDQVVGIADHAEDQVLFFDLTFLPLVEAIAGRVKTIKAFVAMTDRAHMPANSKLPGLLCYEELVEAASPDFDWRWCLVASMAGIGMKTQLKELTTVGIKPIALMLSETLFLAALVLAMLWWGY